MRLEWLSVSQIPSTWATALFCCRVGGPSGVFTWCLVSVLLDLFGPTNASGGRRVSYEALIERVRTQVRDLKWKSVQHGADAVKSVVLARRAARGATTSNPRPIPYLCLIPQIATTYRPHILEYLVLSSLSWCSRLFVLDQMPELTIHTGGNASFEDTFYTMGWPSAFSPPSSPAAINSNEARLRQTVAAVATAAERLSAACCTTRRPGSFLPAPAMLECVEGYSFFDPEKAWLALTCNRTNGARNVRTTSASAVHMNSTLPTPPMLAQHMHLEPLHHTQPYSAAECYRLVQDRQASADSVASYETFAPKKPQSPKATAAAANSIGAAALGQGPLIGEPLDCGASASSGDSPLPPMDMRGTRDQGVGFIFSPGSTLLLPQTKGVQQAGGGSTAAATTEAPTGAAGSMQKTTCAPDPVAAAAREAYIVAAARRISEKANIEAALGAASNAAHQAQLKKLQDVAPQASDLARLVIRQQVAAQQQGGQPAPGVHREQPKQINRPTKIPIYDASPVPIYEATPD